MDDMERLLVLVNGGGPLADHGLTLVSNRRQDSSGNNGAQEEARQAYGGQRNADETHRGSSGVATLHETPIKRLSRPPGSFVDTPGMQWKLTKT